MSLPQMCWEDIDDRTVNHRNANTRQSDIGREEHHEANGILHPLQG